MKERKGNAFALLFGFLLLLSGCAVMLYPHINALWMDHAMRRDAEEFLSFVEIPQEQMQQGDSHVVVRHPEGDTTIAPVIYPELWLDMKAYNEAIFREGQENLFNQSAYEAPSFLMSDYGLESETFGVISIPKLELEMPLFLGASKTNMAKGAAIMGETSLPIGGSNTNCVIAGHRGWNGAAYFLYLNQLEKGDTVTVTNLWETLTYVVMETRIINPDEVDAIRIQPDREMLTLLTCHPPASGGKQRMLIFCERVIS